MPEEVDFKLALEKINIILMTVYIPLLDVKEKERGHSKQKQIVRIKVQKRHNPMPVKNR